MPVRFFISGLRAALPLDPNRKGQKNSERLAVQGFRCHSIMCLAGFEPATSESESDALSSCATNTSEQTHAFMEPIWICKTHHTLFSRSPQVLIRKSALFSAVFFRNPIEDSHPA